MSHGSACSPLRTGCRFLACAALGLASAAFAQTGAPTITLDPQTSIPGGGSVIFTVSPAVGPIAFSTIPSQNLQQAVMSDTSYQAELDLGSMMLNKWNRFQFTLYLNRASSFQNQVYSYQVSEDPTGTFTDLVAPVNFRLSTGDLLGSVQLPLHAAFGPACALGFSGSTCTSDPPVQMVSMGTQRDLGVTLTNQMSGLSATLGTPTVTASCGDCLQTPIPATISATTVDPGDPVNVDIKVNPRMVQSMIAASHPLSKTYDANLELTIPVTSSQGGNQHNQVIDIPIRFSPPLILLALCIALGTLMGGGIRAFMEFSQSKQWSWKEFTLGLIYALVTWAVAYALFTSGGTRVTLVGVSLDPTQLFQSALLCLLAGAGPPLLKQLDNSALKNLPGSN